MNDMNDLRTALFDTLRGLQNKEDPLDIERAKAINDTAQTIINTAKVEVDFCRATGQVIASGFLPTALPKPASGEQPPALPAPDSGEQRTATGTKTVTQVPAATITQHRLR